MSARDEIALELRGAAFGYGGSAVIEDLDLELVCGTIHGLVGANGSGKTTLLRGLLGLLPPLRGVRLQHVRRLRYVPQREALDAAWPLRVQDVVESGAFDALDPLGRLSRAARSRAREALQEVGLETERRRPFAALSGGQRQRALLARALAGEPDALLLDEPTSGVDADSRSAILDLLSRLAHERHLCVALVSHQREELEKRADRLWLASGGRLRSLARDEVRA